MSQRLRQLRASEVPYFAAVMIITLAVWQRNLADAPVMNDDAYFTYLAQAIVRGESIYEISFMGYPPVGLLISAASMALGDVIGVPTYLAPRYPAVLVGAICAGLVFLLLRRATGSAWAGVVGGVILAGLGSLETAATATLTPKLMVVFFTLLTSVALQARRFGWAGFFSTLAATCWQPAIVVSAAAGLIAWVTASETRTRRLGKLGLGAVCGLVPTVAYLSLTNSWHAFWLRAVVNTATVEFPHVAIDPLGWIKVLWVSEPDTGLFLLAAGVGIAWFSYGQFKRNAVRGPTLSKTNGLGGIPLLTGMFCAISSLHFQGLSDIAPITPFLAFWAAWAAHAMLVTFARGSRFVTAVQTAVLVALIGFAVVDRPSPVISLTGQRVLVSRILALAGPDDSISSFNFEEAYIFSERVSPHRYLRLNPAFVSALGLVGIDGCAGVKHDVEQRGSTMLIVRQFGPVAPGTRSVSCVSRLSEQLSRRGFGVRKFRYLHWKIRAHDLRAIDTG